LEIILKYFPGLNKTQVQQFGMLGSLYTYWNSQINVVSRKDLEHLYERHVLHSLGIAKIIHFTSQTSILDVGTGGGFPGIPLAILFPECHFFLVDSIGKKIKVVEEVVKALELTNVTVKKARAEDVEESFDFVISRAVTRLLPFYGWVKNKFLKGGNNKLQNGILYLKGGELREELIELKLRTTIYNLSDYFEEPFFETKKVVHIPINRS
jgi:16S rRNA (guanine527-N7)-methyltransferase